MVTRARLRVQGRSLVMTIPEDVREALGFARGDELTVAVDGDRVILRRVDPVEERRRALGASRKG